jgi:hypothetical protein
MKVSKRSTLTGKVHEMDLPVTQQQLDDHANKKGLAQHIFSHLNPEEREFLMTGITPDEWKAVFG